MKLRETRRREAWNLIGWEIAAVAALFGFWTIADDVGGWSMSSDIYCLLVMEGLLAVLVITAIRQRVPALRRQRRSSFEVTATVDRGEHSMNALYVMYGTTAIVYALAVQVSQAFVGHKVLLIVLNYGAITYLFFFNSWFRNALLFPLVQRVQRD